MDPVDLLIFDHDGTLVDSLAAVVKASNEVLIAFKREPKPAPEIVAGMIHATAPRLGRLAGITDPGIQKEMARQYGVSVLRNSGMTTLYSGIAEMLEGIAVPMAVLSNSEGAFIRSILKRLGVASRFSCLMGEDDMPTPKPDPRGLLEIIERAGCKPSRAAYVGDSRTDLQTARAAGVRAIGVTWGAHPRQELEDLGFDALIDTPADLLEMLGGRGSSTS